MELKKYYVWFFDKLETAYASCVDDAAILATAQRIKSGLRTQITMIEEEKEDGTTEFVFCLGSVFLKETA